MGCVFFKPAFLLQGDVQNLLTRLGKLLSILVQVDGIALRLSSKQLGKPDFSLPTCCICLYHFGRNLLKNKPMSWDSPRVRLSKPFINPHEGIGVVVLQEIRFYLFQVWQTCFSPAFGVLRCNARWGCRSSLQLQGFLHVDLGKQRNKLADSCLVHQLLKHGKAVKTSDAVYPHTRCLTEGCANRLRLETKGCERKLWHGK